jgi:hypothetical protein
MVGASRRERAPEWIDGRLDKRDALVVGAVSC